MRALLAVPLALSLVASCAAVDHGRLAAHGDAAGTDWTVSPTACLSGTATTPPIDAAVFTSESGAPTAVKMQRDPTRGEVLQIVRDVNGQAVTQTFQASQCVALTRGMTPTGWVVNGVPVMRVKAQVDCTAGGVNVAGVISFASCGFSRPAVSTLTALAGLPTAEDTARLAKLPHVPAAAAPTTPPGNLRGLTYHLEPHITGAPSGNQTVQQAEQSYAKNAGPVLGPLGWTEVTDPRSRADLVVGIRCSGHVSLGQHGATLELVFPEGDAPAMTFTHDGALIESVPRLPDDYLCDSGAPTADGKLKDCVARFEQLAVARVWGVVAASQPLAALARH